MGAYINPKGMEKEGWLKEHAKETKLLKWSEVPKGKAFLVWIDNNIFTAIGICFNEEEFDYITKELKHDVRPRNYYLADIDKLYEVSNLEDYLPQGKSK